MGRAVGVRRRIARGCPLTLLCVAGWGCEGGQATPAVLPFAEVFHLTSSVDLEEDSSALIGDIGKFVEARNRDLLLSDRLLPIVRRFSRQGSLLARFGSFGEGPFEFKQIAGLAETASGGVVVVDPQLARVTLLSQDLAPDTMVHLPLPPRGLVQRISDGYVIEVAPGARRSALVRFDAAWLSSGSVPVPAPEDLWLRAYIGSLGRILVAGSPQNRYLATAFSLYYPIYLHGQDGSRADSIPSPPTFRTVPPVEPGAFAGPGTAARLSEWLSSFDVILRLTVVQDSFLVVARGRLQTTTTSMFEEEQQDVDVYHLPALTPVALGVPLPDGVRVVGGGSGLYLLEGGPPRAYTISRWVVRDAR